METGAEAAQDQSAFVPAIEQGRSTIAHKESDQGQVMTGNVLGL